MDAAFKVAWAGFMTMVELTYTAAEAKNATFAETGLTRSDISFAEGDQYAILRLKRSKTDTEHTGVQIILAATGEPTCRLAALRRLFIQDQRPPNAPLFRLQSSAFSRQAVVNILKQRMLDESIQRLGRWTSDATLPPTPRQCSTSNLSFQKGIPLAVPRATVQGPTVTAMRRPKP